MAEPLTLLALGLLLGFVLILFGSIPGNEKMGTVGLTIFLGLLALAAVVLLAVGGCFGLLNGLMTEGTNAREAAFGWTWSLVFLALLLFAFIGLAMLGWSHLLARRGRSK